MTRMFSISLAGAAVAALLALAHAAEKPGAPGSSRDMAGLRLPLYAAEVDTARLRMYPILADTAYLQVGRIAGWSFDITQIKARIVIIEVFSIYCHHCQMEAPLANKLYDFIKNNKLDQEIKIIGVGYESSDFGLKAFRFTYDVRFPLFSDHNGTITNTLGAEVMPSYCVVKLGKNGQAELVYTTESSVQSPEKFLDQVLLSAR
jgi:thiol-disulfide isomerase/thioredoxin